DSRDSSAPGGSRNAWDPGAGDLGEYFPSFSTSLSADTRIYGIAQAENGPWFGTVRGLRHTVIPSVGFTYAPEIDSNPRLIPNPRIGGPVYQAEQRTVNLSLGNEVSLKLAGKDTAGAEAGAAGGNAASGGAAKKGPTYNLATTSSTLNYNFAAPVREWSDLSSSITLYPTPNIPFTLSATHSLYDDFAGEGARDELTSPILKSYSFGWRRGLEAGGDFSSGARVRDSRGFPRPTFEHTPWSASLNYSFSFSSTRVGGGDEDPLSRFFGVGGTFRQTRTHSANGSLKLNPTAGWQMAYDTDYDFSLGRFSRHAFSFHRTLHCWVMDFRWNPVGISEGWSFVIRITELPDIKLESSDTQTGRRRRR
ncbi:MAG TPA: putative LPS assembly protein LptD, partial [Fibrobacteria bacterium]|nr:putative LPS assembly protein LptD [Fibrobacteria bacterium]